MADSSAIALALNLVVDMINDEQSALGQGKAASFAAYGNLLPDFLALMPRIGDIPVEATALGEADYDALITAAAAKLKLSNVKAQAVVKDVVKMLHDSLGTTLGDLEQLAADIKGHTSK